MRNSITAPLQTYADPRTGEMNERRKISHHENTPDHCRTQEWINPTTVGSTLPFRRIFKSKQEKDDSVWIVGKKRDVCEQ